MILRCKSNFLAVDSQWTNNFSFALHCCTLKRNEKKKAFSLKMQMWKLCEALFFLEGTNRKTAEVLLTCSSDTRNNPLLRLRKIPLKERHAKADAGVDGPLSPAAATGCHCWPVPFWRILLELCVTFVVCIKENSKRNKDFNDTQMPSSWSSWESTRMGSKACFYRADPRFVFSYNQSRKTYTW